MLLNYLNAKQITALLEALSKIAVAEGKKVDLCIGSGAAFVLDGYFREQASDIDYFTNPEANLWLLKQEPGVVHDLRFWRYKGDECKLSWFHERASEALKIFAKQPENFHPYPLSTSGERAGLNIQLLNDGPQLALKLLRAGIGPKDIPDIYYL